LQPRQAEYVGLIRQSGDHLHDVINDILDLAKIDAGKLELHEEHGIDPIRIAEACLAIVKERARIGRVRLSVRSESRPPLVTVDATRLKQILLNLLSNAIKFTDPGGSIVIAVRQTDNGGVAFDVRDTGRGMTAAEIAIALEDFGQVDAGLSRHHEGTGLGLPLARRLAELHGGSLDVDSEKGRGTTVTIILPPGRSSPNSLAPVAPEPTAHAA
jgi:signal transduction histidine kinase